MLHWKCNRALYWRTGFLLHCRAILERSTMLSGQNRVWIDKSLTWTTLLLTGKQIWTTWLGCWIGASLVIDLLMGRAWKCFLSWSLLLLHRAQIWTSLNLLRQVFLYCCRLIYWGRQTDLFNHINILTCCTCKKRMKCVLKWNQHYLSLQSWHSLKI